MWNTFVIAIVIGVCCVAASTYGRDPNRPGKKLNVTFQEISYVLILQDFFYCVCYLQWNVVRPVTTGNVKQRIMLNL